MCAFSIEVKLSTELIRKSLFPLKEAESKSSAETNKNRQNPCNASDTSGSFLGKYFSYGNSVVVSLLKSRNKDVLFSEKEPLFLIFYL